MEPPAYVSPVSFRSIAYCHSSLNQRAGVNSIQFGPFLSGMV
jgi:hypothetical protein